MLYEKTTQVPWYERQNTGDSIFKENTGHFKNCTAIMKDAISLDDLFSTGLPYFDLVKIDCQGAELSILKGGQRVIDCATVIILELPFVGQYNAGIPTFLEHIQYMDNIGYVPFDISEYHYVDNILIQVDIAFVKKNNQILSLVQNKIQSLGS